MDSAPILDAVRMEIVSYVAWKHSDHCTLIKLGQADGALGMLAELERIESSSHKAQLLSLIGVPLAASTGPFEHVSQVNDAQDGENPEIGLQDPV